VRWQDAETGLACKGRLDFLSRSCPAIVDLKSTNDVSAHRFASTVAKLGYYGQAAFYGDGYETAHGELLPFVFIAVEQKPPHDVAVYTVDADTMYAGQEEYRELLRRVVTCQAADAWPGQYTEPQTLRLPSWVWPDDEDAADATDMGLEFDAPEKQT
jgi:hypothetical protein